MCLSNLLTIVIPVKNEEKNLATCLENIKALEHVIVVDSGSTDETCAIASRFGREVVQFQWNGQFPKKRNWILRNYKFVTPWVMFLDADELPGPAFWDEVEHVLPTTRYDVFIVYLYNWFLGRILKHGDIARKTAIVRVGAAEYERIEESNWSTLDMEVHEHIVTRGVVGEIKTPIDHNDKRGLKSYLAKHNEYSSWEANRFLMISDYTMLTTRQKLKYRFLQCKWFPLAYFIYIYFIRLGMLDGVSGFYFSILKFCQFYHLQAKIWELKNVKMGD